MTTISPLLATSIAPSRAPPAASSVSSDVATVSFVSPTIASASFTPLSFGTLLFEGNEENSFDSSKFFHLLYPIINKLMTAPSISLLVGKPKTR